MSILSRLFNRRSNEKVVSSIVNEDLFRNLCCDGYTSLDKNPEVITACKTIADLISTMTIHLMNNTEGKGDQRIINELSRKVDINPSKYMTRKTWMAFIVMTMLLYGNGNAIVVPHTQNGLLEELEPIRAGRVNFEADKSGYSVKIDGVPYDPENLLHFVINPDKDYPWKGKGYNVQLKQVADNLKQAAATEKGFLSHEYKPSLIINVDGTVGEMATMEGRSQILRDYVQTQNAGEPWVIPSDLMEVTQVNPLSLSDLAIKDTIELDKKTVASIIGVPSFVLGVGTYNQEEWNNFISSQILPIATGIQQELSRKLLINPKWYFKFNIQSLYNYNLETVASVYKELRAIGVVTGNEVRDRMGMSPRDGLDELVMLENYIPTDKLGDQKKLLNGGE